MAAMASTPEQRKKNLRLGLILASVALAFVLGFVVKMVLYGH
jgi:uncharacterized membrane protein